MVCLSVGFSLSFFFFFPSSPSFFKALLLLVASLPRSALPQTRGARIALQRSGGLWLIYIYVYIHMYTLLIRAWSFFYVDTFLFSRACLFFSLSVGSFRSYKRSNMYDGVYWGFVTLFWRVSFIKMNRDNMRLILNSFFFLYSRSNIIITCKVISRLRK